MVKKPKEGIKIFNMISQTNKSEFILKEKHIGAKEEKQDSDSD